MILARAAGATGRIWAARRGLHGVRPAGFPTGGDFPCPLANDTDTGDETSSFLWHLKTPLIDATSGGVTTTTDAGGYDHTGAADGTYVQAYGWSKVLADGTVVEDDSTITVTFGAAGTPVGVAVESDTALPLGAVSVRAITAATESDTALALAARAIGAVSPAVESDVALPLLALVPGAVGLAVESDTALPLAALLRAPVGAAAESDSALPLAALVARAVGTAAEVDVALPLQGRQIWPIGRADESDIALPLTFALGGAVGMATESSVALALAGVQIRPIGLASERDYALDPTAPGVAVPPYAVLFQSALPPQIVFRSTLP